VRLEGLGKLKKIHPYKGVEIWLQTRQTTRKSEKTKHAHMKMEINENATTTKNKHKLETA
jgi:hypothetical protein